MSEGKVQTQYPPCRRLEKTIGILLWCVRQVVAHSAVTEATCDAIQSTFSEAIWRCGNSADVLCK